MNNLTELFPDLMINLLGFSWTLSVIHSALGVFNLFSDISNNHIDCGLDLVIKLGREFCSCVATVVLTIVVLTVTPK